MIVKFGKVEKGVRLEFTDSNRQKVAIPISFKGFASAYEVMNKT